MADFVGPICYHLRNGVVAKRMAYQMQDFLGNAAHQILLVEGFLGFWDKNFDNTEAVAIDAKLNEVLMDLAE